MTVHQLSRKDQNPFDAFWQKYPRKVAKKNAHSAYRRALKEATAEEIMEGLESFLEHLPDERRFICHPSTWLNGGRWMDVYEQPMRFEDNDFG